MELDFEILHGRMLVCWVRHVGLSSEHQTQSCLPVDFVSSILLDYIPYVPTKHSTIFKLASGRVLPAQKNHWESELRLPYRKTLWNRQMELRQLPKQTGDPGRMAYLKIYGLCGHSDHLCVFFLSLKVTIFVSLCCLDKLMFFYRTREKFMAACRCC